MLGLCINWRQVAAHLHPRMRPAAGELADMLAKCKRGECLKSWTPCGTLHQGSQLLLCSNRLLDRGAGGGDKAASNLLQSCGWPVTIGARQHSIRCSHAGGGVGPAAFNPLQSCRWRWGRGSIQPGAVMRVGSGGPRHRCAKPGLCWWASGIALSHLFMMPGCT